MYTERASSSPLIRCLWHADLTRDASWISPANEFWGIAFGEVEGRRSSQLIGPSVEPRHMSARAGGAFWGAELQAHVFWRGVDKLAVLGEIRELAMSGPDHVELAGTRYPFTPFEQLESFVSALVGQGVLVAEPLVELALAGEQESLPGSERTLRRRVRATTGLGRKQVQQLQRARRGYELLQLGTPLAAAAAEAGFADQSHMTRALGAFAGRTPAHILAARD